MDGSDATCLLNLMYTNTAWKDDPVRYEMGHKLQYLVSLLESIYRIFKSGILCIKHAFTLIQARLFRLGE